MKNILQFLPSAVIHTNIIIDTVIIIAILLLILSKKLIFTVRAIALQALY